MEKRKYIFGMTIMIGLILGSIFANVIYENNLMYNRQMNQLILKSNNVNPSGKLLLYLSLKRGKQYAIIYLLGYLLKPMVLFVIGSFLFSFIMGSVLSIQIIASGFHGVVKVMAYLFPHYIFYGISMFLLFQRNGREEYTVGYDEETKGVMLELLFVLIGIVFECFINPIFA